MNAREGNVTFLLKLPYSPQYNPYPHPPQTFSSFFPSNFPSISSNVLGLGRQNCSNME